MRDTHAWGILGGGFGLYGYLPALAKLKDTEIVVLDKHKAFIEKRKELSKYYDLIKWVKFPQDIFAEADSLIMAVPPFVQEELIRSLSHHNKLRYIVIEKPVATSPELGKEILEQAISKAKGVRIGFSFIYTPWADRLRKDKSFLEKKSYLMQWHFMAQHFKDNQDSWKADHKLGGGALRFYGIHLIAFLESIGQTKVEFSRLFQDKLGRMVRWQACFTILDGATVTVDVDSNSESEQFGIYRTGELQVPLLQIRTPFADVVQCGGEDNRICILQKLIGTFDEPNEKIYSLYGQVNSLWETVENVTEYIL